MSPSDIRCRLCRKPYSMPEGCDVCEEAKKNITWPAMADGEGLDAIGWQAARLLKTNLDALEREMENHKLKGHYSPQFATEASKLGRAVTHLLTELRKLEATEANRLSNATYAEKVELFLDWIGQLPREHQERLLTRAVKLLGPAPEDAEIVND